MARVGTGGEWKRDGESCLGGSRDREGKLMDWRIKRRRRKKNTQDTAGQKSSRFTDFGDPS
jgi:hypothetical protein